jgi:hypothetical protein
MDATDAMEATDATEDAEPLLAQVVLQVNRLTSFYREQQDHNESTINHINRLGNKLNQLTTILQQQNNTQLASTAAAANLDTDPRIALGNNPQEILVLYAPWLSESFIIEIIKRKLEVKDLIKLIPEEERPKGRSILQGGSVFFDYTGKMTTVSESGPAVHDKDFLDFPILINVLSVYGLIRGLYNPDNTGISHAIHIYTRTLSK